MKLSNACAPWPCLKEVTFFLCGDPRQTFPPHASPQSVRLLKEVRRAQVVLFVLAQMVWAAANGGVTNRGLRGVWPPFLEIGRNRPFSPSFCLFRPFPEGARSTWEIQRTEEKGLFPQISSDFLKPPFAALQMVAVLGKPKLQSGHLRWLKATRNWWSSFARTCKRGGSAIT